MTQFLKIIFPPGAKVASVPLVFLSMVFVAVLQTPAQAVIGTGWVSFGIAINELVAVAGVPLLLAWILNLDSKRLFQLAPPSKSSLALVVVATLGAVVVIDYATAASELFIPVPDRVEAAYARLMHTGGAWDVAAKLVALCVLPAVCEEVYFRGFCLTSIAAKTGRWPAIAISALIFSVMHGNLWYAHLYFALGLFLGWVYCVTGSLAAAILCHFINNSWTFLNYVRGFKLPPSPEFGATNAAVLLFGVFLLAGACFMLGRASSSSCSSTRRSPRL